MLLLELPLNLILLKGGKRKNNAEQRLSISDYKMNKPLRL
jgi:hypothetical protein